MTSRSKRISALFLSNSVHKLAALLLAFFVWSLLSDLYVIEISHQVPVRIESGAYQIVSAPTHAIITLKGLRKNIRLLDAHTMAITIPATELKAGSNIMHIRNEHIGLPANTALVHYSPSNFAIQAQLMEKSDTMQDVE